MTRKGALAAIKAAGTEGNQATFLRLYAEHHISYPVALAEYRAGQRFAKRIADRDAARGTPGVVGVRFHSEVNGGAPPYPFCHTPDKCAGKGYCRNDPACNN